MLHPDVIQTFRHAILAVHQCHDEAVAHEAMRDDDGRLDSVAVSLRVVLTELEAENAPAGARLRSAVAEAPEQLQEQEQPAP